MAGPDGRRQLTGPQPGGPHVAWRSLRHPECTLLSVTAVRPTEAVTWCIFARPKCIQALNARVLSDPAARLFVECVAIGGL